MAWAFVQNNKTFSSATGVTTLSVTLTGVASGNTLIVGVLWGNATGTLTVSDNVNSGNYTADITTQGNLNSAVILHKANVGAGSTTITCSFSSADSPEIFAYEFSGGGNAPTVDQTSGQTGASGTAVSSGSKTTTTAAELLFGCTAVYSSVSSGESGWTATLDATSGYAAEYDIVSATGSYAATFTQTGSIQWAASMATYVSGSGGTNPTFATNPAIYLPT